VKLRHRDERGTALILAIAFMVVVGALSASLFTLITSSANNRGQLDVVRDRQYAADAAIEASIARVRTLGGSGPGLTSCGGPDVSTLNGASIRVTCANAPALTTSLYLQRNVIFEASCFHDAKCADGTVVVRAQVNFVSAAAAADYQAGDVSRTYVQSWSVNS
jgi:hypothetical protein